MVPVSHPYAPTPLVDSMKFFAVEDDLLKEVEIGTLEESPMSFRLNELNEGLSRNDQSDEESTSNGDSTM